jgi:outer membrane protein assembly factor BamB
VSLRRRRTRSLAGCPLIAAVVLAGCSGQAAAPAPTSATPPEPSQVATSTGTPQPPAGDDWPTYHRDNLRSGATPAMAPVRTLSVAWRAATDGAVYGQPLVVGGTVFAGTENDTVYALDAATGRVRWSAHLGTPVRRADLPCGNIDPLGITGTMVYDPATRQVFAVAETTGGAHTLYGLDAATGAVRSRRAVEPPRGDRLAHQQRGALTLLDGWVYVPYGGLAGDCGQYIGAVVGAPTSGGAALRGYAIPTSREAGIWSPAGGIVLGGRLLYAVGNGASTNDYDGSDSVIALDPGLRLVDRFWPATWAAENAADLDLGSMTPAPVGPYVFANGKAGTGYVLRADHLGGQAGQVAQLATCAPFGGAAVAGHTIYLPCSNGPAAVQLSDAGTPSLRWRATVPAAGSPAVGGGMVWAVDYQAGILYTLDAATGQVRHQLAVGDTPHFASPTLTSHGAYLGTTSGVTSISSG